MENQNLLRKAIEKNYPPRMILPFLEVRKVYVKTAIDYIIQQYGTVEEYGRSALQLTEDKLHLLKHCYLEPNRQNTVE